jgi:hypothetical protein
MGSRSSASLRNKKYLTRGLKMVGNKVPVGEQNLNVVGEVSHKVSIT